MKGPLLLLFAAAGALTAGAQSIPSPGEMNQAEPPAPPPETSATSPPLSPASPTKPSHGSRATGNSQEIIDRLTRANADLLELLKQQQAVLEDIQYDRRLQNRQITLIEQRLEDNLEEKATLEAKVAKLEAELEAAKAAPSVAAQAPDTSRSPESKNPEEPAAPAAPPQPASAIPPEQTDGAPGTMWWHRLFSLSGDDSKDSELFHVSGRQWRVLWHNQDRPGDVYKNTSALFISAFPKNDTVPKKVCSQLGTGGNATELTGSGDYYLKIEASGGTWELAVEDFR